jgi:hypothetical protein
MRRERRESDVVGMSVHARSFPEAYRIAHAAGWDDVVIRRIC